MRDSTVRKIIVLVLLATATLFSSAYASADENLKDTILKMDTRLFDAYNHQRLDDMKTLFDEDLEFYHDTGGLSNYQQTLDAFARIFMQESPPVRTLIADSTEVYPIKDYGAIQIGAHRFCHVENGANDCGVFKFVQVWHNDDGIWKLKRIISYGH
jgi:hypothetical protein